MQDWEKELLQKTLADEAYDELAAELELFHLEPSPVCPFVLPSPVF